MEGRGLISIWFFIGVLLLIYGIIIFGSAFFVAPAQPTVLSELRAEVWWGALLTVIGAFYTIMFRPGRR